VSAIAIARAVAMRFARDFARVFAPVKGAFARVLGVMCLIYWLLIGG